ncbi:uncharacterized protein BYT42DRAFT_125030 [Radiomyces spectabilis]|uniref:uncharacterized protein n=1 Tax=Radiomyces spectabilis TaxID=64574 RepID=UPI002220CB37|nr:uncharacterized protein BYT42DRAFT_125030 [Radiomyces spectabilis]KAI8368280.1 hypothetical protein BYT42DRAFT_125030 [Radiomyces spectabilis]
MASYFDELNIQSNVDKRRKKTFDVDLDHFMNPTSSTGSSSFHSLNDPVAQTAQLFSRFRQQMQLEGDQQQEQFLDNLVSQLLEESQSNAKGPPPASQRFIQMLPNVPKQQLNSDETCIICKDVLKTSSSKVTQMPCGHYFDQECLVPWLQLHHTCPLCRHEVETEQAAKEEEEEEQRGWMYG